MQRGSGSSVAGVRAGLLCGQLLEEEASDAGRFVSKSRNIGLFQKSLQMASATGKNFSAKPSSLCPQGNQ